MNEKMKIEQSADKLEILRPEMPRAHRLWVIDALTVLAEAFGEPMTPERLRIYAEVCALLPMQIW